MSSVQYIPACLLRLNTKIKMRYLLQRFMDWEEEGGRGQEGSPDQIKFPVFEHTKTSNVLTGTVSIWNHSPDSLCQAQR